MVVKKMPDGFFISGSTHEWAYRLGHGIVSSLTTVLTEAVLTRKRVLSKFAHIGSSSSMIHLIFFYLIQVIGTGDFKQLAPVPNYRYHDPGCHVFNSKIFKLVFPHHILLTTVSKYRRYCSQNDTLFLFFQFSFNKFFFVDDTSSL